MNKIKKFLKDTNGDTVVEATILFPIIIIIFSALILMSFYLPVRATLQRATQYAATALATEKSDTWLFYNEESMSYEWETNKSNLPNVYAAVINAVVSNNKGKTDDADRAETIVSSVEESGISIREGDLTVEYELVNYVVYKEIAVTASRTLTFPINVSFIGFSNEVPITVTSTAVVQNGDEFLRNINIGVDFVSYIREKNGNVDKIFTSIQDVREKFKDFFF